MLRDNRWKPAAQDGDKLQFADEATGAQAPHAASVPSIVSPAIFQGLPDCQCTKSPEQDDRWKILVVDDDHDVLNLTCSVLRNYTFEGRTLRCYYALSGQEAQRIAASEPDLALIIMDVVMESDHAGLEAVRHIREVIRNHFVRIVLRTGQPGFAPEEEVVNQYDINDYKEKGDLSVRQLRSLVTTNLRAYRDLRLIESLSVSNQELERRVRERTVELHTSRESLARAQSIAHVGSWEWLLESNEVRWSDEGMRILGYTPERTPTLEAIFEAAIVADREGLRNSIQTAMQSGSGSFLVEHRVVHADGDERMIRHLGAIQRNESGHTIRVEGTLLDITELREAEGKLSIAAQVFDSAITQAEDLLKVATKIFENSVERVTVTDMEGTILAINPAFTRITGYTVDEVVGKNANILQSDRHDKAFFVEMWRTLFAEGRWQGEIWNRHKNGEDYPERLSITAIRGPLNRITHFVSISENLSDIRRSQEEVRFMTYHDALTGLPNRHLFMDRLQQAINFAHRTKEHVAVVQFDVDMFKYVNESLGHAAGDLVLTTIADRFRANLRDGDTVSRLAGDRFGFIIRDVSSVRNTMSVVEKLRQVLGEPIALGEHNHVFTASIGITLYPNDAKDVSTLMRNVDISVSRAKKAGRDTFQFYTQVMGDRAVRRLALEGNMRKALENHEFILHYQPKVNALDGRIMGMEALVRWHHPETGMLSPSEFIPVAEETGLIVPLGEWILRTACQQTADWRAAGFPDIRVAVNLSARQFRRKDFLQSIKTILTETGLPPQFLDLEITESMVMDDVEEAIATLRNLQEMGIMISVDDFGTGYSSLNYLKQFPIHTLKIDQSFIRNLPGSTEDASIISAIISMARSLHLNVVAEGVETADHLHFLQQVQCNEIQGFLFSKPLPPEKFLQMLEIEATGKQVNIFTC